MFNSVLFQLRASAVNEYFKDNGVEAVTILQNIMLKKLFCLFMLNFLIFKKRLFIFLHMVTFKIEHVGLEVRAMLMITHLLLRLVYLL